MHMVEARIFSDVISRGSKSSQRSCTGVWLRGVGVDLEGRTHLKSCGIAIRSGLTRTKVRHANLAFCKLPPSTLSSKSSCSSSSSSLISFRVKRPLVEQSCLGKDADLFRFSAGGPASIRFNGRTLRNSAVEPLHRAVSHTARASSIRDFSQET